MNMFVPALLLLFDSHISHGMYCIRSGKVWILCTNQHQINIRNHLEISVPSSSHMSFFFKKTYVNMDFFPKSWGYFQLSSAIHFRMFHEIKHPFPLGDPPVTMETPTEKDACLIHSQLLLGPSLGLEIRWVCLKILVYKYIYITIYIQYYIYITIIYLHILYIYTVCIYNIYIYILNIAPTELLFRGK